MKWLRELLKAGYRVVEVEKPRVPILLTEDVKASIGALGNHPGFVYLISKLKAQRGLLESKLKFEHHESIREVITLQSGIFWCNWLEGQVNKEVYKVSRPTPQELNEFEKKTFREVQDALELVGES